MYILISIIYTWLLACDKHARVMFPVYVRLLLERDLQNCSVSALDRFRFIDVHCAYKTIRTCRDQRTVSDSIVFRFIRGPP